MNRWPVAVLFARADSIYYELAAEVFDEARDARTYTGNLPVVAHPPCRAFGRFRAFAKPDPWERNLAHSAVAQVRRCGGVLEHPAFSTLWPEADLPPPRLVDRFGGWTLPISQWCWGHLALKKTWLYIVGVNAARVPPLPWVLGEPHHTVCACSRNRRRFRPEKKPLSPRQREETPRDFAVWLLQLAASTYRGGVAA